MHADLYERALIIKLFIFQFANNYTSFFYIAFLKGWDKEHPGGGEGWSFLGLVDTPDKCTRSNFWNRSKSNDCVYDLFIQMVAQVLLRDGLKRVLAVLKPLAKGRAMHVMTRARDNVAAQVEQVGRSLERTLSQSVLALEKAIEDEKSVFNRFLARTPSGDLTQPASSSSISNAACPGVGSSRSPTATPRGGLQKANAFSTRRFSGVSTSISEGFQSAKVTAL